jgi:hypothetical protein
VIAAAAAPTVFLAISDIHGQVDAFPPDSLPDPACVDVVLLAGDISEGGLRDQRGLARVNDWMQRMTERYRWVYWVPGNHDHGVVPDFWDRSPERRPPWCIGLDRRVSGHDDYMYVGCSLSTCFDFPELARTWCNMTASEDEDRRRWEIPPPAQIVLSHSPPLNCCDQATGGRYIGSPGLRDYIRRYEPRLVVCGHVHEAAGYGVIGRTPVFNVARNAVLITLHPDGSVEWEVDRKSIWGGQTRGRIWSGTEEARIDGAV